MSRRPSGKSHFLVISALAVVSISISACEADAPPPSKPSPVDAGAVVQRVDEAGEQASGELEKIRATATAAAPDLGGSDAVQKSGVNE